MITVVGAFLFASSLQAKLKIPLIIDKFERDEIKPSVEVASKIADALEVSLDFLVGETNVEIDAKALKWLQDIEKSNDNYKVTVFGMAESFLSDSKAKKVTIRKCKSQQRRGHIVMLYLKFLFCD